MSAEDVDQLRQLGLSDAEIFDVVAAASARCFFAKTLDALGVQPDAEFTELAPEVREALVTGPPDRRTYVTASPRRGTGDDWMIDVVVCP